MQYIDFIKKVEEKLTSDSLPGQKAQKEMMPEGRNLVANNMPLTEAAVLILIVPVKGVPSIVFIKRTEYNGAHSGQISFPGGKRERNDLNLLRTALRETNEEIDIDINLVNIIGQLTPLDIEVSGFKVYPYVGYTLEDPVLAPEIAEVQFIIKESISNLLNTPIKEKEITVRNQYTIKTPYLPLQKEVLWGATLMIFNEFRELIKNF